MKFTDEQIYEALVSQVKYNPSGATAIDVFSGLGLYQEVTDALGRLVKNRKLAQTSPGNYLPTSASYQELKEK